MISSTGQGDQAENNQKPLENIERNIFIRIRTKDHDEKKKQSYLHSFD